MKTVDIGKIGEKLACKFLRKNGYKIIKTNIHVSHNEIDIIAKNREYIVFVEVKTRSTDKELYSPYGSPASAVDKNKQARTISAARIFLSRNKKISLQPRFDVIEVFLDKSTNDTLHINHIINAFSA